METDKYQQTTKPFKVVASVPKEQQLSIKKKNNLNNDCNNQGVTMFLLQSEEQICIFPKKKNNL